MDLFKFPFQADVWGTASEWIMIVVTGITAWFLYKTLQSQNRLYDIEHLRLREDYKPKLKYQVFENGNLPIDIRLQAKSVAIINNGQTSVKNVYADNPVSEYIWASTPSVDSLKNILTTGEKISLNIIFKSFDENVLKDKFQFIVHYEDMVGFKYQQAVVCYFESNDKNNLKTDAFDPRLVE